MTRNIAQFLCDSCASCFTYNLYMCMYP